MSNKLDVMDYIVFDLEFNMPFTPFQTDLTSPGGKLVNASKKRTAAHSDRLAAEIIEIGAVRVSSEGMILDEFHRLVKAHFYKRLNPYVAKLTKRKGSSLRLGDPFPLAIADFWDWCGRDFGLVSWSHSDSEALRSNLKVFQLPAELPCRVLDLQSAFQAIFPGLPKGQQVGLGRAMDLLALPKDPEALHGALVDARCTAQILAVFLKGEGPSGEAMTADSFRPYTYNPNLRRHAQFSLFFERGEHPDQRIQRLELRCPECSRPMELLEPWSSLQPKRFLARCRCPIHGPAEAKVNLRLRQGGTGAATLHILLDDQDF